jgi:hypothetical protein
MSGGRVVAVLVCGGLVIFAVAVVVAYLYLSASGAQW